MLPLNTAEISAGNIQLVEWLNLGHGYESPQGRSIKLLPRFVAIREFQVLPITVGMMIDPLAESVEQHLGLD
jgi:hypothetical protein